MTTTAISLSQGETSAADAAALDLLSAGQFTSERAHQAARISSTTAASRNDVGYTSRLLLQATFPLRSIDELSYRAVNGNMTVTMLAARGLPYGVYPRLIVCWLTQQATLNALQYEDGDPRRYRIDLGPHLESFMREVGVPTSHGKTGTVARFRDQLVRLFTTTISVTACEENAHTVREHGTNTTVSKSWELHWSKQDDGLVHDGASHVTLSPEFFDSLIDRAVPLDMGVLRHLRQSPLAIDLYLWLTYRMSYLKVPTVVSWPDLMNQFGTSGDPNDAGARRNFKANVKKALTRVKQVYPLLRVSAEADGLLLKKSPPSVPRKHASPSLR